MHCGNRRNCSLWAFILLSRCFQKSSAAKASENVCLLDNMKCIPNLGSSVGSDVGCQSRGCEFESQLGQHFWCLIKVTVTCVIRLSPMGCLTVYVEEQPDAWKVCCVVYWCGKTRKCMSRWTDRRDMTKKLLKRLLTLSLTWHFCSRRFWTYFVNK